MNICECCGQPEGKCPSCGAGHSPALPAGTCELCSPERTIAKVESYYLAAEELDTVKAFVASLHSVPTDIVEYRWVVIERETESETFAVRGENGKTGTVKIRPRLAVGESRDLVYFRIGWSPEGRLAVLKVYPAHFPAWIAEQRRIARIREAGRRAQAPERAGAIVDRVLGGGA